MEKDNLRRNTHRGRDLPPVYAVPTRMDTVLDLVNVFLMLMMWMACFRLYQIAPDIIPIHFNAKGQADGWGGKDMLFAIAIIGTVIGLFLLLSTRFSSHFYNYMVAVNKENIYVQHQLATRMNRILAIDLILLLISLLFIMTYSGLEESCRIYWIVFFSLLTSLFIIGLVFLIMAFQRR